MIKKKEVIEKRTIATHHCDDCDHESKYICKFCKKDLCYKCLVEDSDCRDYLVGLCKKCYISGESYRNKIKELDRQIDILNAEWENECKYGTKIARDGRILQMKVTGCNSCPMFDTKVDAWCKKFENFRKSDEDYNTFPEWCKLTEL